MVDFGFGSSEGGGGPQSSFTRSLLRPPAPPQQSRVQQPQEDPYSIGRAGTAEQFPDQEAQARLEQNQRRAQQVAESFERLGMDVPGSVRDISTMGYEQEEPGFLEKTIGAMAGNPVGGGVLRALNVLGGPARVIQTALKTQTSDARELQKNGYDTVGFSDMFDIFWGSPEKLQDIALNTGIDPTSGSQLLSMWGWDEAEKGDTTERVLRFGAHAVMEIVTDPFSYLSLGAGGVARKALGESADATVRRVTREALSSPNVGGAAHDLVRSRYDDMSLDLAERIGGGEYGLLDDIFPTISAKQRKGLVEGIKANDEVVYDDILDGIDNYVVGNALSKEANVLSPVGDRRAGLSRPGKLLDEMRNMVVSPAVTRSFKDIPEEWVAELPAYARGGMRVVANPFAFGRKNALESGWVIPGTVGSGRKFKGKFVEPILDNIGKRKFPFSDSKTIEDVLSSTRKGLDTNRTLIKAVHDGKLTGAEYMVLQDALSHGAIDTQLAYLSERIAFEQEDVLKTFNSYVDGADDLLEVMPKPGLVGQEALDAKLNRQKTLAKSLYQFITREGDELRVGGHLVDQASDLYTKAADFRVNAREVMGKYDDAIGRALGDKWRGRERFLPTAIGREQREFVKQLAIKVPRTADDLALSGEQGGIDYFVSQMLNATGTGGVTEAAIGSNVHFNAKDFNSSISWLADESDVMFVDKSLAESVTQLLENVKAGEIDSVMLNDLIEGKLKDLAAKHNVPLPKNGSARIFEENPFTLVDRYAHSMENTLRQRNAVELMREYGLTSEISPRMAVQRTLAETERRLSDKNLLGVIREISDNLAKAEQEGMPPVSAWGKNKPQSAHWLRAKMTSHSPEGWSDRIYDHLTPEERVGKYLGSDDSEGLTMYRRFDPMVRATGEDFTDQWGIIEQFDPRISVKEAVDPRVVQKVDVMPDGSVIATWREKVGPGPLDYDWVEASFNTVPDFNRKLRGRVNELNLALAQAGSPERAEFKTVWTPQAQHAGTQSAAGMIGLNETDVIQRIKLKKGAVVSPGVVEEGKVRPFTDHEANFLQRVWDKYLAGGRKDLRGSLTDQITMDRGDLPFPPNVTEEDMLGYLDGMDVLKYVNGGEDAGTYSFVVLNKEAVEDVRRVDPNEPVAWLNMKKGKLKEGIDEPGQHDEAIFFNYEDQQYELRLPGELKDMSAADKAQVQREFTRFVHARQGQRMVIQFGEEVAWEGNAHKLFFDVDNDTVLSHGLLALQRIYKGSASVKDDIIGQAQLVEDAAKSFRKNINDLKEYGFGEFDPEDSKMLEVFGEVELDGTPGQKIQIWVSDDGDMIAAPRNTTDLAELGYKPIAEMEASGLAPNALSVYPDQALQAADPKLYDEAVKAARWFAKRSGKTELHRNKNLTQTFRSFDMEVDKLNNYTDWSQVDDWDVYNAVMAEVGSVHNLPQSMQKSYLGGMYARFGGDAVSEALKTPKEIIESEIAIGAFMDNLRTLFNYGRDADGNIVDSTKFLTSGKQDPFEELLKTVKKQGKALGIDPETFKPTKVTLAEQFHEVTLPDGRVVERNLVNPNLFGIGGPALKGELISTELGEWFAHVTRNSASLYTPQGFATFAAHARQVSNWWKGMATVTRPTFHVRNLVGGVWNNQIIGVRPRDYNMVRLGGMKMRRALESGKDFDQALKTLPKKSRDVFQAAFDEGVMNNGFAVSEFKRTNNQVMTAGRKAMTLANPLSQGGANMVAGARFMETLEDFLRVSAFAAWYDPANPATAKVAREMAYAVQFNYKDLTNYETKVKQFLPFFVWQRRNIPLQLQTLAERPGLMTRYAHLMEAAEANFGGDEDTPGYGMPTSKYLTAFATETGIVLNEGTPFWTRVILDPDIPPVDLFDAFDSINPLEIVSEFSEGLNPLYTGIFDFQAQQDFGNVNAPAPINIVTTQLARAGIFDVSTDGDVQMPYWLRTLYNTTIPFASEYSQIAESGMQAFGATGAVNDPKRLAQMGIAEPENDPDSNIANALQSLGMVFGKGVGIKAQTPRDTAGPAYGADTALDEIVGQQFRNNPEFEETYEAVQRSNR